MLELTLPDDPSLPLAARKLPHAHGDEIYALDVMLDRFVLTGGADGRVVLTDVLQPAWTDVAIHRDEVYDIVLSEREMLTCSLDGEIMLTPLDRLAERIEV